MPRGRGSVYGAEVSAVCMYVSHLSACSASSAKGAHERPGHGQQRASLASLCMPAQMLSTFDVALLPLMYLLLRVCAYACRM
jgi:hypothetical protein